MKRILVALSLILLGFGASAETILLAPTPGAGSLREFVNVPNDAGATITIYSNLGYATQYLYLDGVMYTGPNSSAPVQMVDALGHTVILTTAYTSHTTCQRSGRGQTCSQNWVLQGVSIVR